jgi:hypothetical protein
MLDRHSVATAVGTALRRSPVAALMGPRQCGKTTLARAVAATRASTWFDLESSIDRARLQNPELVLGQLRGLVVLDEIQMMPELFAVLRVLADRPKTPTRFLILGSASPSLVRGASESLAGRVEFVELGGFTLAEVPADRLDRLWTRGGFPRSFLSRTERDSAAWREGFVQTFLVRDLPQLGLSLSAPAMRRFWTMVAHYHGQTWNGSALARSMGVSDKTVRAWLDVLTGTFMVRQLQPWFANVAKRQVKAPKVYIRDTGLLHALLGLSDRHAVLGHPAAGASWEGMALEQVLRCWPVTDPYYWATHGGAELDLLFTHRGRRYGVEFKMSESPVATRSMHVALADLSLAHLWTVYPGQTSFPIAPRLSAFPLRDIAQVPRALASRRT